MKPMDEIKAIDAECRRHGLRDADRFEVVKFASLLQEHARTGEPFALVEARAVPHPRAE